MSTQTVHRWKHEPAAADVAAIRRIVTATAAFSPEEIDIACELAEDRLARGAASGYEFVIAEVEGGMAGYACYGRTPGTERAYDLYWIAVDPARGRRGLGGEILDRVESAIDALGGAFMIAETSSTPPYAKARAFYERAGFRRLVEIDDFYRPGDNKIIFRKDIRHG